MSISNRKLRSFVFGQIRKATPLDDSETVAVLLATRKIASMAQDNSTHVGARLLTVLAKEFNKLGQRTPSQEIALICQEEAIICKAHALFRMDTDTRRQIILNEQNFKTVQMQ